MLAIQLNLNESLLGHAYYYYHYYIVLFILGIVKIIDDVT